MPIQKICPICGKTFLTFPCKIIHSRGKFCSRSCGRRDKILPETTRFYQNFTTVKEGCWEWVGPVSSNGYGHLGVAGKTLSAHRYAYKLLVGPIPEGMFVLHHCDNRLCVRPDHLFLGTQTDNVADKMKKGRHPRGTQLPQSKITEDNVREILLLKGKESSSSIAYRLGISKTEVCQVWKRRVWSHVIP